MTEKIESKSVVKPEAVSVHTPSKFELFLDAAPELMKHLAAVVAVGVVIITCLIIVASDSPGLEQFKQTAFTTIVGIGTGALGFLFGSSAQKGQ